MNDKIKKVEKFYKTFLVPINKKPTLIETKRNIMRFNLMNEENNEYLEATQNNDLVEISDALGDMLYILCGTIIEHGMQNIINDVFNEIHESNMSKLDEKGKPIFREDGKILKSDRYLPVDLTKL